MALFFNILLGSLIPMCVTAMVTMAITLIFKTSLTTNFAQGVLSALGAYIIWTCCTKAGLPLWAALPIGMLTSMGIAILVDVGIFRRGRYVNALGKQIITMGLITVIVNLIPIIFGEMPTYFKVSFVEGVWDMGNGVMVDYNSLICAAITAVVLAAVFVMLRFSKWGLSVRATASNEYVAGMMGINTHVVTAISWGLAGALGVLAAAMNSVRIEVSAYFMTEYQVNAFLAGIVGGFATFYGPVLAGLMIPLMTNLVTYFGNMIGVPELSGWALVIVYVIVMIIIFFKPSGIFGKRLTRKV